MDETKILDLSMLNDQQIITVKKGFAAFLNGSGARYFGGIPDKATLKKINKLFGYTNKKAIVGGIMIGFGCSFVSRKIRSIWNNLDPVKLDALKTFLGIYSPSEELHDDCKGD